MITEPCIAKFLDNDRVFTCKLDLSELSSKEKFLRSGRTQSGYFDLPHQGRTEHDVEYLYNKLSLKLE